MNQTYMLLRYQEHINELELNLGPLRDLGFKPLHFLQLMILHWSDLITIEKAVELLMTYAVERIGFDEMNIDLTELEDSLHIAFDNIEDLLAKDCIPFLRGSKWQLVGLFQDDALIAEVKSEPIDPRELSFDFLQGCPSRYP